MSTMARTTSKPAYVYGITWAKAARRQRNGVAGADVMPIVHRDVAALVSPISSATVQARRRDLLRHTEVLQAATARATIVPLRFGTVLEHRADVVTELLAPRYDDVVSLLHRLDGLVELTVRAYYDEAAALSEIVRDNASIARLQRGAAGAGRAADIRLGEAVAAALADKRAREADQILSSLLPLARDVVVDERQLDLEVLRAAFLVDRRAIDRFDAKMDELARRRAGVLLIKYTGPLAPHHFVAEEWAS